MLTCKLGDHRSAETLAVIQDAVGRNADFTHQKLMCRPDVASKSQFAGAAWIPAVPAVVEEQHGHPLCRQRPSQWCAKGSVASVAVRHQYGYASARFLGRHEPRAQNETVTGVQLHVASARNHRACWRCRCRRRQVDETPLKRPHEGQQQHDNRRNDDDRSYHAFIMPCRPGASSPPSSSRWYDAERLKLPDIETLNRMP